MSKKGGGLPHESAQGEEGFFLTSKNTLTTVLLTIFFTRVLEGDFTILNTEQICQIIFL